MGLRDTPDFRELGQADDFVVGALAPGFPHVSGGGNELREILVRSDHVGLEAVRLRAFHESPDDIVRLEAVDFQHGNAEGAAEVLDVRDGGGEFLRHLVALGLVGRVFDVAGRGCGGVESHADVRGELLFEDGKEGVDEAVEGGGVDAFGVADGILDKGKVCPVDQGHAVEEEEAFHVGETLNFKLPSTSSLRQAQGKINSNEEVLVRGEGWVTFENLEEMDFGRLFLVSIAGLLLRDPQK